MGHHLVQGNREELYTGPEGVHARLVPEVGLAQFQEPSALAQHGEAGRDRLAGERIEHQVDALAAGRFADLIGKIERAGIHHVLDAQRLQVLAFPRAAGGGEDLRADLPGNLDRGQSHAAGGRVDQHPLARLHPAQPPQGVLDRKEADRDRGRFFEAQMFRLRRDEFGERGHVAGEAGRGQSEHRIARLELFHSRSDGDDLARALAAQRSRIAGIQVQDIEHVAEIQARGADLDLDLAGSRAWRLAGCKATLSNWPREVISSR